MSQEEAIVDGTLHADGTLDLDAKPGLPPGRVRVIVRAAGPGASPPGGLADVIDQIRQGQQARGFHGRSIQEIEAGLRQGEDEYEQRLRAGREQPGPAPAGGGG